MAVDFFVYHYSIVSRYSMTRIMSYNEKEDNLFITLFACR